MGTLDTTKKKMLAMNILSDRKETSQENCQDEAKSIRF